MAATEEVIAERMWNYLAPSGDKKVRFWRDVSGIMSILSLGDGVGKHATIFLQPIILSSIACPSFLPPCLSYSPIPLF